MIDLSANANVGGENARRSTLTGRESQILELAANGKTDKEISILLRISRDTVASYWRRILLKFAASSRTEVVARHTQQKALEILQNQEQEHERLLQEINDRSLSEARDLANRNLLSAISEASMAYINGRQSVREVFEPLLNEILALTTSEYGFISEVMIDEQGDPYLEHLALTNIAWNTETHNLYKTYLREGLQFRNLDTLFGSVLKTGSIVISDNPSTDPRRGGLPTGHPTMHAFLGIPVFSGTDMVAMIGIANRPGGYSEAVVEYLEPILGTCANIVSAYRSERERRQAQNKLEESERLIRLLVDGLPFAVLFEDQDRKMEFMNSKFGEMFSIPAKPADLVGMDCSLAAEAAKSLFADPDGFLDRVNELLALGHSFYGEVMAMADGRRLRRDLIVIRSDGSLRGYLWMYCDVSQGACQ